MYGGIPQKKLTEKDMTLNCQNIREEFEREKDIEHQRVNVDSAKKKAVLYHHDYEGFRQMVLGANLYTIKSKELQNFGFNENNNEKIYNPSYQKHQYTQEEIQQFQIHIKEIQCKNFRDFRTLFQKHYIKPLTENSYVDIMNILQAQNKESIHKIFSLDFHVDYFFKILEVFTYSLNELQDGKEISFMVEFLYELTKVNDFVQQIKKFLKKIEKEQLKIFIDNLKERINQQYETIQLNPELNQKFIEIQPFYS